MRKSVEHLGPQHRLVDIHVDRDTVLRVCPEFEVRRFYFMVDFLKKHGRLARGNAFPVGYTPGAPTGRCYDNAMALALAHEELIYCEGVMLFHIHGQQTPFPLPHGWCCTPSGVIVDPTCAHLQARSCVAYLGVPVSKTYHEAWKFSFGYYGLLDGHPVLGDSVGVYVDDETKWRDMRIGYI